MSEESAELEQTDESFTDTALSADETAASGPDGEGKRRRSRYLMFALIAFALLMTLGCRRGCVGGATCQSGGSERHGTHRSCRRWPP